MKSKYLLRAAMLLVFLLLVAVGSALPQASLASNTLSSNSGLQYSGSVTSRIDSSSSSSHYDVAAQSALTSTALLPDPTSPPNYCDGIHAEYPAVVKAGDKYYAYYSGYSCSWQIYYATSNDGIHFDKQGAIHLSDGWAAQRAFPFVLYENGKFRLYYGGGLPYQIGYAESADGVNFTATTAPVLPRGVSGAWDRDQVLRPSIVVNSTPSAAQLQRLGLAPSTSELYLMYYNGFGNSQSAIGLAYSTDGLSWQRYAQAPVFTSTTGIYTSFAISETGTTYLYYHTGNAIYLAESSDGISFSSYSADPILSPSTTNGWDAGLVYGAFVRPSDSGGYVMYYNGIPAQNANYGMVGQATSPDLIHYTPRVDNPVITVGNTPANFTATANVDDSITVSWHDVVTDANSYSLQYGVAPSVYTASIGVTGLESYTFFPPTEGDYYMTVEAVTDGVVGYPAAERMVHIGPASTATPLPTSTATATPLPSDTPTATTTLTFVPTATDTPLPLPTNCPNTFVDIVNSPFYTAIHYLACQQMVSGEDNKHYNPSALATRAQFAKVIVLAYGLPSYTPTRGNDFTDVPPSHFAYAYIESAYINHVVHGFDAATCAGFGVNSPCFLPEHDITRAALTKMVVGAAQYPLYTPTAPSFSDVPPSNIFYTSIETAYYNGVIQGYPDRTFGPNKGTRRDEMAQIVYKGMTMR